MSKKDKPSSTGNLSSQPSFRPLVILMLLVFVAWAVGGYLIYGTSDPGKFGDMFGAVNSLFSGLAFAGVIYAILLQRRELELQREELRSTRVELARTAKAQEKSEQALSHQVAATEYGQRIVALNNMLEFARSCHLRLQREALNAAERQHCEHWASRRIELMTELDTIYRELVGGREVIERHSSSSKPSGSTV